MSGLGLAGPCVRLKPAWFCSNNGEPNNGVEEQRRCLIQTSEWSLGMKTFCLPYAWVAKPITEAFRVVAQINFQSTSCAGTSLSPHPMRGEGSVRGVRAPSTIGFISELHFGTRYNPYRI